MKSYLFLTKVVISSLLCFIFNLCYSQFNMQFNGGNRWGRLNPAPGINATAIGIGTFTSSNQPAAALHVNTIGLGNPFYGAGEVFRTDCPDANTSFWKMFRGGQEKVRISSPTLSFAGGTNDIMIENWQRGAMLFRTGQINRMIILDGSNPNALTGFVGIGNNFYAPASQLHVSDGANDTYMQITNNFSGVTAGDGFRFGVLSTGEVLLNQQEDMPIWFRVNNIPSVQIHQTKGFVGIGDYSTGFIPKNMLHIHDGPKPAYVQFTNNGTSSNNQPVGTDGFLVGIKGSGEAFINHQQAFAINFKTNNLQRAIIDKDGHAGIGDYTSADSLKFRLHVKGDGMGFLSTAGWNRAIKIEAKGALVWDSGTQINDSLPFNHFFMAHPAGGFHAGAFFAGLIPTLNTTDFPDYVYKIFGINKTDLPLQGTFQFFHDVLADSSVSIGKSHLFPQRNLDVFNDSMPQLRLSQTVSNLPSITPTDGVYTDFTTTSAADLLIEPFKQDSSGKVGINISSSEQQPTTELDVDGNGRFRKLPLSSLTRIVVAEEDGTLGYNDSLVLGGGGIGTCTTPTLIGTDNGAIDLDGNNFYFLNGLSADFKNKVSIGYTCGSNAWGKLSVIETDPNTTGPSYAGYFENTVGGNYANGIASKVYGTANNKIGVWGVSKNINSMTGIILPPANHVGVSGIALEGTKNIGVYGQVATTASGTNWAGYFDGIVHINGSLTVNTTNYPSDIILKTDVDSISDALNIVNQLKSRKYNFNTTLYPYLNLPDNLQFGLMAEDLQTVLPDLVSDIVFPDQIDTSGNITIPGMTYKGINYNGLIPVVIQGIQELDAKVNNLSGSANSGWSGAESGNLFASNVYDRVNIGITTGFQNNSQLFVENKNSNTAGRFTTDLSLNNTGKHYGLYSEVKNVPSSFGWESIGLRSISTGSSTNSNDNYGIWTTATNGFLNVGIKSEVFGSGYNKGGTFYVSGNSLNYDCSGLGVTTLNSGLSIGLGMYTFSGNSYGYGLQSSVTARSAAYGAWLYTQCTNGVAFGIYSTISNTRNDFAGYFYGNVQVQGNLYVSGTYPGSDNKLKDNVQSIDNAMNIINQLQPKTFNYRVNEFPRLNLPEGNLYGLIAQDVETILPDLVKNVHLPQEFDSLGNVIADSLNYKALNYTALIPVLVQGLKETKLQNDSLKTVITSYETRFANIEALLNNCCQNQEGKLMQGNSSDNSSIVGHQSSVVGHQSSVVGHQSSVVGHQSLEYDNTEISSVIHITPDNSINSTVTELYQNRPNPFTTKTTFTYQLGKTGFVELEIHSELGAFVAKLVDMNQEEGSFSIDWNTADIAPGIYFYSLKVDGQLWVKKAVRIK